jgi:hypothetical protein
MRFHTKRLNLIAYRGNEMMTRGRLLLLILFTTGPFFATHSAVGQQCDSSTIPRFNQVIVYDGGNFDGQCRIFEGSTLFNLSDFGWNNRISSVKVGNSVRLHAYNGANRTGQVATYEASSRHCSSCSDTFSLGPRVNNTFSSIAIAWAGPGRVPYIYIGNYPSNRENFWSNEAQGLCHNSRNWFIANNTGRILRGHLWKVPLSQDLNASSMPPGSDVVDFFDRSKVPFPYADLGYWHFGDPDCTEDFVLIPVEHGSKRRTPLVAIFQTSDLAWVGHWMLEANAENTAAWVAIDPFNRDQLWSSNGNIENGVGIKKYRIEWSFRSNLSFIGDGPILKNRHGNPINLKVMQGGAFSQQDEFFYLTNSDSSSADGRGLWGFDRAGELAAESGSSYGPFNFEHCCGDEQEPEGIDFLDTTGLVIPGLTGTNSKLHVILLNNDFFESDNVWLKHYRSQQ